MIFRKLGKFYFFKRPKLLTKIKILRLKRSSEVPPLVSHKGKKKCLKKLKMALNAFWWDPKNIWKMISQAPPFQSQKDSTIRLIIYLISQISKIFDLSEVWFLRNLIFQNSDLSYLWSLRSLIFQTMPIAPLSVLLSAPLCLTTIMPISFLIFFHNF